MAYDISCKMIRNDQICDYGWHVGDEIYFSASDGRLSLPGGHGCVWALHDLVELILELSRYIPSWAKRDENGEPYLTYRCTSIAPVWWEVRRVGEELGLPHDFVWRHPFPGPGLAVRILGEITREQVATLQEADAIAIEEIRADGLYDAISQALCVLLPVRAVGVMGDARTYDQVMAIRAVTTTDFMTADWFRFPPDTLDRIARRVVNEVAGINRVVYDITSKPPGTIEWE